MFGPLINSTINAYKFIENEISKKVQEKLLTTHKNALMGYHPGLKLQIANIEYIAAHDLLRVHCFILWDNVDKTYEETFIEIKMKEINFE